MKPFKEKNRKGGEYPKYRGHLWENGKRRKVVLTADYKVSKRRLAKMQAEADARADDLDLARRREHAKRHITVHASEYVDNIKRTTKSKAHHRITEFMMRKLIELAEWNWLDDMTAASLEGVVKKLQSAERPATAEYCNCFIKRAKAFANWCVPDRLLRNPFVKVKRNSVLRTLARRRRRAALPGEIEGLMNASPDEFVLKWAFMMLTGFRRSEMAELLVEDLRLNATIPFIQLRHEWTKNAEADFLPLHPALVEPLKRLVEGADPGRKVFDSVPDNRTFVKYFEAGAGVILRQGRVVCVHALRHTFKTNLDFVGCSESTKKALLRHAVADVSGGYSHPRMEELYTAICKLPSPFPVKQVAVKTGTDCGTYAGQMPCGSTQPGAASCTMVKIAGDGDASNSVSVNPGDCVPVQGSAWGELNKRKNADIVRKTGPSTQVD